MPAYKDSRYGWKYETNVDIGNGYAITILTMKRSNGELVTNAQRVNVEDDCISFMMHSDFNRSYVRSRVRISEKVVTNQHEDVLSRIEQIKTDCADFYKDKE